MEGLMLKLKLQYFGHPMGRTDSLVKTFQKHPVLIDAASESSHRQQLSPHFFSCTLHSQPPKCSAWLVSSEPYSHAVPSPFPPPHPREVTPARGQHCGTSKQVRPPLTPPPEPPCWSPASTQSRPAWRRGIASPVAIRRGEGAQRKRCRNNQT